MITWSTGTLKLEPKDALLLADARPETAERMFERRKPTYLEALPATYIGWWNWPTSGRSCTGTYGSS